MVYHHFGRNPFTWFNKMHGIIIVLLCSTVYVDCSVSSDSDPNINEIPDINICSSDSCSKASNKMLSKMDESVNPCEDFYEFACGEYLRKTDIPEDKSSLTSFSIIQDEVDKQLEKILTEEPQQNETKPFKLAKIFTKTCLDEATLNERGIQPLVDIIEKYGGWPVVKGDSWKSEDWDWLNVSQQISNEGLDTLILESYVSIDLKNTSKRIVSINRAPFGLSRKFLLKGMEHEFVKAYYDFMVDAAVIFGANKTNAEFEFLDVLQFESELAKMSLSDEERRNKSITYNPFTIKELQAEYPFIDWLEYINEHLLGLVPVDENEVVIVVDKNYLMNLNAIIQSTSKRTIANYCAWRLVLMYSEYLNDVLHKRNDQYVAAITGKQKSLPRLTECVQLTMAYLSISAGASYVKKHFNEESKKAAAVVTKSIHEQFLGTLHTVPWMDEESRAAAIVKANKMYFHIGYSDELVDDKKLEEYYRDLELQPDSLIRSIVQIHKFFAFRSINKLRIPVNKTDWETHSKATSVNAFYSPAENSIQLPAAVLRNPFFSTDHPAYMNFAAIGWFVAHEITHGFDDEGRQFDSNGNVANWWQEDTITRFTSRAQCFIEQYSNFNHPTLNLTVNGVNTQGENIADNGAIKGTYEAYQKFVDQNGPDLLLPSANYTANQLFWISAAQIWCAKTRPEFDKLHYATNVHAPHRFRVIGTFRNSANFATDFNCVPGSKMNPIAKCTIW